MTQPPSNMTSSVETYSNTEKHVEITSQREPIPSSAATASLFEPNDAANPRNWPMRKKCITAVFILVTAFNATFGTPIYVAAIPSVQRAFHITTTLAISPSSFYAYGLAFGALLGTAFCEIHGRAIVYRVSIPLSFLFTLLSAKSTNIAYLGTTRALAGLFSGPCLTVGAGVLNDLWDLSLEKTGTGFAVLYAMSMVWATQAGPMASASIVEQRNWRWVFWCQLILYGLSCLYSTVISETYGPEIARRREKRAGKDVGRGSRWRLFLIAVGRPLHMIIVEPIVLPTALVLSVTQSVIFAYYVAYAILFERVYHFTQYQVGLSFSALLIGSLLSLPIIGAFDKFTYQKARSEALRVGKTVEPEMRLYPAMLGSITLPISLFWLAQTGRQDIHWIVPTLSGVLFGISYVLNVMYLPIYNNDVYTIRFGASVLAASTFVRFLISSSFLLFTDKLVDNLGFSWAISLLGFISVVMVPVPWIFFKWGPRLRAKSRYLKDEIVGMNEDVNGKV